MVPEVYFMVGFTLEWNLIINDYSLDEVLTSRQSEGLWRIIKLYGLLKMYIGLIR